MPKPVSASEFGNLDQSLRGMNWRPHHAGPRLIDKIEIKRRPKREWTIDPKRQSARLAVLALGHGSTAIRSHVDIDTDVGLRGFDGVAAAREAYRDEVDIEIVAFPQSGPWSCRLLPLSSQAVVLATDPPIEFGHDGVQASAGPQRRSVHRTSQ